MAPNKKEHGEEKPRLGRFYERPQLRAIDLSLEETLAEGCKLGTDPVCLANFEAGS